MNSLQAAMMLNKKSLIWVSGKSSEWNIIIVYLFNLLAGRQI